MAVQSVDRALGLLAAVRDRPGGLAELSDRAALPLSTTSRLLATLAARGAVARDADGRYHVGPFVRRLATADTPAVATIESCAAGAVASLADRLDEAAAISLPLGTETLTLMQIAAPKPVQAENWAGHRWPIGGGGSGAAMLSTWPESRVEATLAALPKPHRPIVRREVDVARRSGVSWAHGTYVEGLSSVAAPVVGSDGHALAAVLAYGPSYRFPADRAAAEQAVIEAGEEITTTLADRHG